MRLNEKDGKMVNGFLDDLLLQGKSERTVFDYRSCLRVFRSWLHSQGLRICDVQGMADKEIIERFLRYLSHEYRKPDGGRLSYKRKKSIFTALNGLYEYLEYNGFVEKSIILTVRKRYLQRYKQGVEHTERKTISQKKMGEFINSIPNLRDRTMVTVFVKTGIRRNELIYLDVDDVDLDEMRISLKKRLFHKRSNAIVFFDEETKILLQKWLKRRKFFVVNGEHALFVGQYGNRIDKNMVYSSVVKWAKRFGIYDESSPHNKDHFSIHNFRHCFTTYMRQNGMPREFIKELRGDSRGETIDIYDHIDQTELKREYLATVPTFHIF